MSQSIKVVVVGDQGTGKTSLLITYGSNKFPSDYVPSIFDNYSANVSVDGRNVTLCFWDTSGREDDSYRHYSYPGTDVFIIMFRIDQPPSLDHAVKKWYDEVHSYCPTSKIILAALHVDTRGDPKAEEQCQEKYHRGLITTEEGQEAARSIGACYAECSAKILFGVKELFDLAASIFLLPERGTECHSLEGDPRIVVGSEVIIHRHREVDGEDNWASGMDEYDGKRVTISRFTGTDSSGCKVARVKMDDSELSWAFRVRDMELVSGSSSYGGRSDSLEGDPRIVVGSEVIIHRHREVDGEDNWASGMDEYDGKRATISRFTGTDSSGCKVARVKMDDSELSWAFRVRDMELVSGSDSLEGDPRIVVGSEVIIHRHREVDGEDNWASGMDEYDGRRATISRFTGTDSSGCKVARVKMDDSELSWAFRVRDMELVS